VIVSFVVDTAGRADVRSLTILKSTHELFAAAVRAALPGMRFIPAEAGGKKVRQLVLLPFAFTIIK
jgi:protein TonB